MMIAVWKQAMMDIKHHYIGNNRSKYMDREVEAAIAISWIKNREGTFDLCAECIGWHPDYLQKASLLYIDWFKNGAKEGEEPELYKLPKERTRIQIMGEKPEKRVRQVACLFCSNEFTSYLNMNKWTIYCPDCYKNRARTYADTKKLFVKEL